MKKDRGTEREDGSEFTSSSRGMVYPALDVQSRGTGTTVSGGSPEQTVSIVYQRFLTGGGIGMYRKRAGGWLKHLDFIVLDALCLQAAFMLAYAVRMGPSSPYSDGEYRGIGLLLLLADMVIVLLSESFSGVLRRGRYEEFTAVLRHACLVEAVVIMYLFTAQKAVHYSRFIIYLTGILYVCAAYFARYLWKALLLRRREAAEIGRAHV